MITANPRNRSVLRFVVSVILSSILLARSKLFHSVQQSQRVRTILLPGHWMDCAPDIVHQAHGSYSFHWIRDHHCFLHCQMCYSSGKEVPRTVCVKWMVPFQMALQGHGTFDDARRLHGLCRLDGETCRADLSVVRCIAMDGLETLRMVFKGGKPNAPFSFS